jgi:hypothetical protein
LIILTTTVHVNYNKWFIHQGNSDERRDCYLKAIKQWLEKSSFKICLVENSGYTYPELSEELILYQDRFEFISYNESEMLDLLQLFQNNSKGSSELYAIDYAYKHSKFKPTTDFVIKITGRYFIPDLEPFLIENSLKDRSKERGFYNSSNRIMALRQDCNERCELVGSHVDLFSFIFSNNLCNFDGGFHGHVESVYNNRIKVLNPSNVLTCNEFKIEPTIRGGVSSFFDTI